MSTFTLPISVTSTPTPLKTILETAGYTGSTRVNGGTLYNTSTSVECYIHYYTSGSSGPTGTNGMPFGPASPSKVWHLGKDVDLATIWLYAASTITVNTDIDGRGEYGPAANITVTETAIIPGTGATNLGKAEDAAHTSGDTGVMALAVRNDSNAAFSGTDLDYTPVRVDSAGNVATRDQGPAWTPVRALLSSADASSIADLSAAPTSGQKIVVDDWWFSTDTAMRIDLSEQTSATILWSAYLPANGSVQFTPRDGLKLDTADKKVRVQTSVAGNVRGVLLYHSAV